MTADEVMRRIEQLHRQQQSTIADLMEDPDNERARLRYRMTNAAIRALRMSIAKEKPAGHERAAG